ncbi:MAG: hypothetical protein J5563_08440 [Clostridia bacterium]|nr:hypothetical protein [Clostridia bacterium]
MKKTLLRVVCAIVVVMMALSVVVNAEGKKVYLAPTQSAGWADGSTFLADGGYYVGDFIFKTGADDLSTNGITFTSNADARHIWAGICSYEDLGIFDNCKYLHYTIPEGETGLYKIELGALDDATNTKVLTGDQLAPGKYVEDLSALTCPVGYCYIVLYNAGGKTTVINDFFLSDSETDEVPAVETADMIGIFATIAAAAAAVVVFTKKH